jgi:predicted porin
MKQKSLAALISLGFAAPVFAQSSVTLYGIADAGFHFGSGSPRLVSGIADGSRLGFKGTEDLGDGYKAIFNVEARVELNSGRQIAGNISPENGLALTRGYDAALAAISPPAAAALRAAAVGAAVTLTNGLNSAIVNNSNALFDRTSMVGLVTPYGAILGGRMYTPGYEVLAAADPFETGTAGGWGTLTGGAAGLLTAGVAIRSDNAVQYRIQTPGGFGAALMYGFKNSGYVGLDDKFWAMNVRYNANGWNVGLGYNHGTDQNGNSGLISWTVGGSYAVDNWKFFAGYHNMKNENSVLIPVFGGLWDTSVAPKLSAAAAPFGPAGAALVAGYTAAFKSTLANNFKLDADSWTLGMHYRMGAGRLMGSVNHVNDKTSYDADATQYSLGYDYGLSKRTDIYSVVSFIHNQNSAQYAPGAASAPGGFTATPGDSSHAFQIGIRHRF